MEEKETIIKRLIEQMFQHRERLGLTQKQAAELLGKSEKTYQRWESSGDGLSNFFDIQNIFKILQFSTTEIINVLGLPPLTLNEVEERTEVRNQETNRYDVVEHTKTNRDRYVPLVPKAMAILEKIPKQGNYIFMRNGERITARQIAYVLEKYAERQGIDTKSTHKMRKTFASLLNANGVPLDCIREILGHSSLTTTLGYVYNPLTESETYNLISKAL